MEGGLGQRTPLLSPPRRPRPRAPSTLKPGEVWVCCRCPKHRKWLGPPREGCPGSPCGLPIDHPMWFPNPCNHTPCKNCKVEKWP
jgi:hypothetical protein